MCEPDGSPRRRHRLAKKPCPATGLIRLPPPPVWFQIAEPPVLCHRLAGGFEPASWMPPTQQTTPPIRRLPAGAIFDGTTNEKWFGRAAVHCRLRRHLQRRPSAHVDIDIHVVVQGRLYRGKSRRQLGRSWDSSRRRHGVDGGAKSKAENRRATKSLQQLQQVRRMTDLSLHTLHVLHNKHGTNTNAETCNQPSLRHSSKSLEQHCRVCGRSSTQCPLRRCHGPAKLHEFPADVRTERRWFWIFARSTRSEGTEPFRLPEQATHCCGKYKHRFSLWNIDVRAEIQQ